MVDSPRSERVHCTNPKIAGSSPTAGERHIKAHPAQGKNGYLLPTVGSKVRDVLAPAPTLVVDSQNTGAIRTPVCEGPVKACVKFYLL